MENLKSVAIYDLVKELENREGVKAITAEPYQKYSVDCTTQGISDTGPAVILVVTD